MEKEEIPKPILLEDLGLIYETEQSKKRKRWGKYKCGFCGSEFEARTQHIKSNITKSCGCYGRQTTLEGRNTKHSLSNSRVFHIWSSMKRRVLNPNTSNYNNYGGRGITICDEWKNDVKSFYDWAISNGYSDELSIDRIDNDGDYCPENCRWTTKSIQSRNTRVYKNNSSGFKGVSYTKAHKKFKAQIKVNKILYHLGYFQTAEEGAIAYNNYIIENNLGGFILNEIPEEYLNQYIKEER